MSMKPAAWPEPDPQVGAAVRVMYHGSRKTEPPLAVAVRDRLGDRLGEWLRDEGFAWVFHRLEKRVRGHVLICMLAAYLTWHLRQAWAPLTYTDEEPPEPADPVAPAARSASAEAKARRQHDEHGRPYLSYQGLLDHLATLARNELGFHGTPATVPVLTDPTSRQQEAFDLIGAAIPLTLKT